MPSPRPLLFALALAAAAPAAAEGRLDTGFAQQGFAVEGFQAAPGSDPFADADIGIVACGRPGNPPAQKNLVASGFASGLTRVVTMFLTPAGTLDTSMGIQGKQSFALPVGTKHAAVGHCQPDGKLLIAYNLARNADAANPHHELLLLRIDGETGLPDATFGSAGTLRVDLDALLGATTISQQPFALGSGLGADLVLSGSYERPTDRPDVRREHGFVLRITGAGVLADWATSAQYGSNVARYHGGGVDAHGRLRLIGSVAADRRDDGRLQMDALLYATLDDAQLTDDQAVPDGRAFSARMLDDETLAVAASLGGQPAVLLAGNDDGRWGVHRLPRATVRGAPAQITNAQLAPLADGLVYAGSAAIAEVPETFYAAKLVGGAGGTVLDRRFGSEGRLQLVHARQPGCSGPDILTFSRFTLWRGALTALGAVDSGCSTADSDFDYAVLRLTDRLFGDAFEARYPVR